ncbi:CPBP family intramembrane glutamic endopeptidase [Ligilactobacillus animalis]|uniref:CPBP family intramembrane glutamic endopeptidase n=2 Tax=Ligilactobacillus animalis TaxID=1605 RepID=UPI0010A389CB|nr:type II CAAX endopeptidase family protein [Ligilactobacillus animalis]MDO5882640.1 type II CAAX endopeptidase family protein [Ligilactobacillus animalis]MDU8986869.1 type II CAAX endopeptidase family protein [Ligilactobacillus animalis]THE20141.1 CAAX protease [Ligilactobacillus animalis]
MDKLKRIGRIFLWTLLLMILSSIPMGQIMLFKGLLMAAFSGDLGDIFSPLALGLGLIGEIIVVFILKQAYKGDPKQLHQIMPFDKKGSFLRYATGYVLGIAFFALIWGITVLGKAFSVSVIWQNSNWAVLLAFLLGFGMQGMTEEVIFRGYLQGRLEKEVSQRWAILISALAFAVAHLGNSGIGINALVGLTLFGILMGLFRTYTGDLWLAGAFHSAWNFAEGPLFGTPVSGINGTSVVLESHPVSGYAMLNGGTFGIESSYLVFVGLFVLVILTYYLGQNYAKPSNRINS